MDKTRLTTALDTDIGVPLKPVRRIEVLAGMAGRRRVWTLEQKLALVSEMERCDNVAAFAREREVSMAPLYTWRRELRYAIEAAKLPPREEPMFVPVVGGTSQPSSHDRADHLPRIGYTPTALWLPLMRGRDHRGTGSGAHRRGWHPYRSADRAGTGCQVRRSPAPPRQAQIYPSQGIDLDRSTLADWVGRAA
ncbi:transposase [Novosphingobium sp.]|uniref:transposase n=1 Tax=Novosphingobium sp. TaxID=1874826 RepID=UPI0039182411